MCICFEPSGISIKKANIYAQKLYIYLPANQPASQPAYDVLYMFNWLQWEMADWADVLTSVV